MTERTSVFKRLRHGKWVGLAAKLLLSVLAFWLVFKNVDFSSLPGIMHSQKSIGLVAAAACSIIQSSLGAMRWRQILKTLSETGQHLMSAYEAFKLFYIGVFFNSCLPGTVGGDVVRIWLTKSEHIPTSLAINSVVIDRLIALIGLGVLVALMLPWLGQLFGFNPLPWLLAAVVGAMVGIWLLFNLERLLAPWKHVRPVSWVLYLVHCLRLLFKHRGMSAMSVLYAIISHVSFCFVVWSLAQSMDVNLSVTYAIALVPLVLLITILPISMGGWGLREASMVGLLGLAGVARAQALTISVEVGLLGILLSLPAGILWLGYRKRGAMPQKGLS